MAADPKAFKSRYGFKPTGKPSAHAAQWQKVTLSDALEMKSTR